MNIFFELPYSHKYQRNNIIICKHQQKMSMDKNRIQRKHNAQTNEESMYCKAKYSRRHVILFFHHPFKYFMSFYFGSVLFYVRVSCVFSSFNRFPLVSMRLGILQLHQLRSQGKEPDRNQTVRHYHICCLDSENYRRKSMWRCSKSVLVECLVSF